MRARATLILALLALAGCGPTPPQAPPSEAKKLDSALGGMSYACGQAYQVTAFGGTDLAALDVTASSNATELARIYRRNPDWIYQSDTVRKIVKDADTMLHSCGLRDAARTLERETG
jgi:hypothetical protein